MTAQRKILVVFKTHLDLGYTDLAAAVLRRYLEDFIPQAMATARELRERGGSERFVWTTGSWLISEFLEQSDRRARRQMEAAIAAGDLRWHALPFTLHAELADAGLFEFGLSLSAELGRRFGKKTVAAKITDVPGMTRAAVPLLARAGVKFLHIGVNPATPLPAVPPVFRWREPAGAEVVVAYSGDYGRPVAVPGLGTELHFAHTGDNHGPQTAEKVIAHFAQLRAAHPGAEVAAGTLEDFAAELEAVRERLPVVTAEIGDTWIHGVGSDPWKVARYRALLEWRRGALRAHPALASTPRWRKFSRALLCVPEHTWGRDTKIVVPKENAPWLIYTPGRWRTAEFHRDRRTGLFAPQEASWREQREYLREAVAALGKSKEGRAARAAVAECEAAKPERRKSRHEVAPTVLVAGHRVRFDARDGSLVNWLTPDGRTRADAAHPLGVFSYQIFSPRDVERWYRDYPVNKDVTGTWARPDFTKFGYERVRGVRARRWSARATDLRVDGARVRLRLEAPGEAVREFGCPREISIEWRFDPAGGATVTLQWFGKQACRMPEAAWFSFVPDVRAPRAWRLVKLGAEIDPHEVVRRGNRRLHAVEAMRHPEMAIVNRHAPLVRLGEATLLDFRQDQPDLRGGLHFNLVNNAWGTNFPQWSEDDARFEFELR